MKLPALGIRARTTLTATVVVGVALVLGSVGLVLTMRFALRSSIEAAAATRASDIALLARSGALPASLPGRGESLLAQVVVGGSKVVASSPSLAGQGPISSIVLSPGGTHAFTVDSLGEVDKAPGGGDAEAAVAYAVTALGVQSPSGPMTVLVAASLSPLEDTSDALVPLLLAGVPLVLLVLAGTVWALAGLALSPVEGIRAEAESISSSVPDRRLPVPNTHDEIRDLAETMNRMLDRIEAAALLQRRFTADASHELKSPVAAIRTMLEVAQRDPSGTDVPALIADVLAEDLRLERLVADLLVLGRSDEGELRLSLSAFDLAPLVCEEAGSVAAPTSLVIDTSGVEPVVLKADGARIRQLLRNLLDNAVRHARGQVWVTTHTEGDAAVMTVSDDGPGIPVDKRDVVFERFVRLDDARGRSEGGTGLGLAVCRAIVRAHGGEIRVVEPAHGGATLEARIPLRPR